MNVKNLVQSCFLHTHTYIVSMHSLVNKQFESMCNRFGMMSDWTSFAINIEVLLLTLKILFALKTL